jgi:hypothetical protein
MNGPTRRANGGTMTSRDRSQLLISEASRNEIEGFESFAIMELEDKWNS